jgi:hypothetical protein
MSKNWPQPKFSYGDRVKIIPLDRISARVIDLHQIGMASTVEYDVRYFSEGKDFKTRVFEDELEYDN